MSILTPAICKRMFGEPKLANKFLVVWDVPAELEIGGIPKKIYCHKAMVKPLETAFRDIVSRGLADKIKTWDGCFNIRKQRGSLFAQSLHSWALAFDINAAWNALGKTPTMDAGLVDCFKQAGFDWGGDWRRPDGMHFQLSLAKTHA